MSRQYGPAIHLRRHNPLAWLAYLWNFGAMFYSPIAWWIHLVALVALMGFVETLSRLIHRRNEETEILQENAHKWGRCGYVVCNVAGDMRCGTHRCLRCGKQPRRIGRYS